MTEFFNWLMKFFGEFKLLAIVLPWELAIRTRFGNRVKLWQPGCHIRLPFFDNIDVVNTRLRIVQTGTQTLTTLDGHILTVAIAIGFRIADPKSAMLKFHSPEGSCCTIATSVVAELVSRTTRAELRPPTIEQHVTQHLKKEAHGYEVDFCRIADFVYAKTYRLLTENTYRSSFSIEDRKL